MKTTLAGDFKCLWKSYERTGLDRVARTGLTGKGILGGALNNQKEPSCGQTKGKDKANTSGSWSKGSRWKFMVSQRDGQGWMVGVQ
jgi:hypothetical protein